MLSNECHLRPTGYTGALHQYGSSDNSFSAGSALGGAGIVSDKKWGETTSKSGEICRVFVGGIDYKGTNCQEIGSYLLNDI